MNTLKFTLSEYEALTTALADKLDALTNQIEQGSIGARIDHQETKRVFTKVNDSYEKYLKDLEKMPEPSANDFSSLRDYDHGDLTYSGRKIPDVY